jgi:hypothetical protein
MAWTQDFIDFYQQNRYQGFDIYVYDKNDRFVTRITDADIVQNSLSIDAYSITGDTYEIGTAIASELQFDISNHDGRFDNIVWEGCRLSCTILTDMRTEEGLIYGDELQDFYVDSVTKPISKIHVIALDAMCKLDKQIDWTTFLDAYDRYVAVWSDWHTVAIAKAIADVTGLNVNRSTAYGANRLFDNIRDLRGSVMTYRNLVQYLAFIVGGVAQINNENGLEVSRYDHQVYVDETKLFEITPDNRYSSDIAENPITITGIGYTDEKGEKYFAGADGYVIDFKGNPLLKYVDIDEYLQNILDLYDGFSYLPFEATMRSAPFLLPGTPVLLENRKGELVNSIITHMTYKLNGATKVAAKGVTKAENEYVNVKKLTPDTQQAIDEVISRIEDVEDESVKAISQIYYLSNSETAPTLPTEPVTESGTGVGYWTLSIPSFVDGYSYWSSSQVEYVNGTYKWTDAFVDHGLTDTNQGILDNTGSIEEVQQNVAEIRTKLKWTLIKQTMAEETITGLEDAGYSEFLLTCQIDPKGGQGYNHERVMASTTIPAEVFFGYTTDHGNGASQAYYTSTYNSGVSYLGNNKVKLYHPSGCYARLYAR